MKNILNKPLQFIQSKIFKSQAQDNQVMSIKTEQQTIPLQKKTSSSPSSNKISTVQDEQEKNRMYMNSQNSSTVFKSPEVSIQKRRILQLDKLLKSSTININELRSLTWNGISFGAYFMLYFKFNLECPDLRARAWRVLLGYSSTSSESQNTTLKRKREEYYHFITNTIPLQEDHSSTGITHIYSNQFNQQLMFTDLSTFELNQIKQITNDIKRTMPGDQFFCLQSIKNLLSRVLYIWSIRHPASGYVQGFNDLCIPFLCVFLAQYIQPNFLKDQFESHPEMNQCKSDLMPTFNVSQVEQLLKRSPETLMAIEADIYHCLCKVLSQIQDNYINDQPGALRMMDKLQSLIATANPKLHSKLKEEGIEMSQFSFRWINCFLTRQFSIKNVIRLWDAYLSEDGDGFSSFHIYVCSALLLNWEKELDNKDMSDMMLFLQDMPTQQWDQDNIAELLAKSYQLMCLYREAQNHLKKI